MYVVTKNVHVPDLTSLTFFVNAGQEDDGVAGTVGLANAALHQDPAEEEEHGESRPDIYRAEHTEFFAVTEYLVSCRWSEVQVLVQNKG